MECGYDVPFSSEVEPRFHCPICLLVLRKPLQTACGHRFCSFCIKHIIPVKNTVLTCPVDKTYTKVSQMFPDVATEREILSLRIECTNVDEQCEWRGELRDLDKHIMVCDRELVLCANGCPMRIQRADVEAHIANCSHRVVKCEHCGQQAMLYQMEDHNAKCPKFPMVCSLCSEAVLPRDQIEKHQSPTEGQCKKTIIKCPYSYVGCQFQTERQLVKQHTDAPNALHEHMELVLKWMVTQGNLVNELSKRVRDMHETSRSLLPQLLQNDKKHGMAAIELRDRNLTGKLHWKIKLGDHRQRHISYYSPAFYTGCPGYRVQLNLNLEGPREGNVRFTSLTLTLLAGDYDNQVIFPFNATCIVTLYDQGKCPPQQKDHITNQMVVREVPRNNPGGNIPVDRIHKREISKYIRRPELIGPNSRFIKNGCLHFEVTVIHSYCPPPEGVLHPHTCSCPVLAPKGCEIGMTPKRSQPFRNDTSTHARAQSPSLEGAASANGN